MNTLQRKEKEGQKNETTRPVKAGKVEPNSIIDANQILYLQGKYGNHSILQTIGNNPVAQRLLQDNNKVFHAGPEVSNLDQISRTKPISLGKLIQVMHNPQHFSATIRRTDNHQPFAGGGHFADGKQSVLNPLFSTRYHDAMTGNEPTVPIDFNSFLAQTTVNELAESIHEPQEGETVHLPDIVLPPIIANQPADTIADNTLSYNPTITQSGPPPIPFGETFPNNFIISGIAVTKGILTYDVTATVDHPITFQVTSGENTNISSDTDPNITQDNYCTVASDLTPYTDDLNGRPPRSQFWAEDLTIRHEQFHAAEAVTHATSIVKIAQNWLNGQTAFTISAVKDHLSQALARIAATVSRAMSYPGREYRAYGDGAPSYLARATTIKMKGDAKGYPENTP
jgi:hypothetical protein